MALKYKIISTKKPGQGKEGENIYYPKLTGTSQKNLHDICHILEHRSTASPGDVALIVYGLIDLIPDLLTMGYTVKLDGFGSFRLHARVNTSNSPDNITVKNIKELRLSFLPDKEIKRELQKAEITKAK